MEKTRKTRSASWIQFSSSDINDMHRHAVFHLKNKVRIVLSKIIVVAPLIFNRIASRSSGH